MKNNQSKEQPIKGWVKASERLPETSGEYFVKDDEVFKRVLSYSVLRPHSCHLFNNPRRYEWLDETPIHSGEERLLAEIERLKESFEKEVGMAKVNFQEFQNQLEAKDKEIERLKGLIEKMYWKLFQHHLAVPDNFQQFKTENSLLSSEQNVQASVATEDDQGTEAGKQSTTKP